ncbi:hypothetical protein [Alteromonas stellipolaris]|uniref:Uncharacterized protein n=1 Tax=Alteromonas stellipolaris TaxID=233316 RepID=A0ABN4LIB5_9ALTE|nr:hypothetical protein [Alteromonas stellipolaris]AMJ73668.1 hypothetical protein AVL57_06560 [Alteromonas stellipolaris]
MQKTIPYKPDHFYFLGSTVNQVIGFRAARGTGPCEVKETANEGYYLEYAPSSNLELHFTFKHHSLDNGGKCLVYEIPETFNLLSVSNKAKQMGLDL